MARRETIAERLSGPPRTIVIGDDQGEMPAWQLAICCFVTAIISFWLAVGHS